MIRYLIISFLLSSIAINCSGNTAIQKNGKYNTSEHLYGKISSADLYHAFPEWKKVEEEYQPDKNTIASLLNTVNEFNVEIFIGTWCSDSEREVPRFLKIFEQAELNNIIPVSIYAVDRNKELGDGLAKKRDIQFVPTFIFYMKDHEIGRIIESPDDLLEKDIARILLID